jgi:SAM-dependent methyltransferase
MKHENLNTLEDTKYNRARFAPTCGDSSHYLHLSDIRLALEPFKTEREIDILDFGCGGSPYRGLFPRAVYRRADFASLTNLDYVIDSDSGVSEQGERFDMILSTQVLEHVPNPGGYLKECNRLLKKGGVLLCTTHGTYEDHGCPFDFQRWTADGLRMLVQNANFKIRSVLKLTTGPRALMFLVENYCHTVKFSRRTAVGLGWRLVERAISRNRASFHSLCDRTFATNRVVHDEVPGHAIYLCIQICAEKTC